MADDQYSSQIYLDFDIEISEGQGRSYPLSVRSPAGEARATMEFPFGELALQNRMQSLQLALLKSSSARQRQVLTPEEKTVRDFGKALFKALLVDDVGALYQASLTRAEMQEQGLRLRLRIHAPELAVLPWEYLYDVRQREYVCLSTHTPLVRFPESPLPQRPMEITPPLRILGVVSAPGDQDELEVGTEKARLETALEDLQKNGMVEVTWLQNPSWRVLQRTLRPGSGPWHVFHFVGHGGYEDAFDEGVLLFCDQQGRSTPLRASQLARLLVDHRALRLALLNACRGAYGGEQDLFSSTAAILSRRGLPAVLAMQYEISDRAAIEFSSAFYEALVDQLPVDAAVAEARKALSIALPMSLEWGVPALYLRSPDGILFKVRPADASTSKPAGVAIASQSQELKGRHDAVLAPKGQKADRPKTGQAEKAPIQMSLELAPGVRLEFVLVPAGPFLMGSSDQDQDAQNNEKPQRSLELPDYWIAKLPLTNQQYQVFVAASGHHPPMHWKGAGVPDGMGDYPVVNVSWEDAVRFCRWASQATSRQIRLPSEAEWEKAARGVLGSIYPWGDQVPDATLCNYRRNIGYATLPGNYSPQGDSPFGCVDMAGNVLEWTCSLYERTAGRPDARKDNKHLGGKRVLRGGSYYHFQKNVRCAYRTGRDPTYFYTHIGFRVVVSPVV